MCPGSTDFMKCSLLNICCKLIVTNGNYSSDGLKGKMRLFLSGNIFFLASHTREQYPHVMTE